MTRKWYIKYSNGTIKKFTGTLKEVTEFVHQEGDHVIDWGKDDVKQTRD